MSVATNALATALRFVAFRSWILRRRSATTPSGAHTSPNSRRNLGTAPPETAPTSEEAP